jgi:hypothetical protein
MEIFNKHIFGSDAEEWLKLSKDEKTKWIKTHTNQSSDELINELIETLKKDCKCGCIDCGKNKDNGNISKTNVVEDKAIHNNKTSGNSSRRISKGRNNPKTT